MKKNFRFSHNVPGIVLALACLLTLAGPARGQVAAKPLRLSPNDRIMIFSPHPDDAVIGTAGVIQEAEKLKIPVRVVYLTNGDSNELAFMVYKKMPILGRSGVMKMGELRRKESTAAMKFLGLPRRQMIFLGYPDMGTLHIFTSYWNRDRPLKSLLTRVNRVPYWNAYSYGSPYVGESIFRDVKNVIRLFKPTKIFLTNSADTNGDHQAAYLFVQTALWDLRDKMPMPELYPFLVHVPHWPKPRGYHPDLSLNPPPDLKKVTMTWFRLDLSREEIEKKKKAIDFFKSQNAYNPWYLYSFARNDELFGRFPEIVLTKGSPSVDWDRLETEEGIEGHVVNEKSGVDKNIESATYAREGNTLLILLRSRRLHNRLFQSRVYLIPYRYKTRFSEMPKYELRIINSHKVVVLEQRHVIFIEGLKTSSKKGQILITIPLSSLNNPDYILTGASSRVVDVPVDATAWRVLKMK